MPDPLTIQSGRQLSRVPPGARIEWWITAEYRAVAASKHYPFGARLGWKDPAGHWQQVDLHARNGEQLTRTIRNHIHRGARAGLRTTIICAEHIPS